MSLNNNFVGELLYRGVDKDLCVDGKYNPGDKFCWWGFVSTSTDLEVAKGFATNVNGEKGTIFYIKCSVGLNVNEYSAFPTENEVLLRPGLTYEVVKKDITGAFNIITIRHDVDARPKVM